MTVPMIASSATIDTARNTRSIESANPSLMGWASSAGSFSMTEVSLMTLSDDPVAAPGF